jgi:acyl carrier protein
MKKIDSEDFVSCIKDAFERPPEDLGLSSLLRDLHGWDSLTSVMLVAEIYADYRVQISGEEMRDCRTVADLMALVEAKFVSDS